MTTDTQKANEFARRMKNIPSKVIRCEIYGTASRIVDEKHALNILRKVVSSTITANSAYEAICIMQDRLDLEVNPARGWRAA